MGIAPQANVINVKVSDDQGAALTSDLVNGLQWVLNNKGRYNIRVVNLSLNSATAQSYQVDPIDAACEILWFNGVVVVTAAGNNAGSALPARQRPVRHHRRRHGRPGHAQPRRRHRGRLLGLRHGDQRLGQARPGRAGHEHRQPDDGHAHSAAGTTPTNGEPATLLPHVGHVDGRAHGGGRGGAAPATEPSLTPDQVKYRLKATAVRDATLARLRRGRPAGAGYLDVYAAAHSTAMQSANTGIAASQLLWTGSSPVAWNSVNWDSVNWGSVNWSSVNWNSVNWGSVNWGSDYWGR